MPAFHKGTQVETVGRNEITNRSMLVNNNNNNINNNDNRVFSAPSTTSQTEEALHCYKSRLDEEWRTSWRDFILDSIMNQKPMEAGKSRGNVVPST